MRDNVAVSSGFSPECEIRIGVGQSRGYSGFASVWNYRYLLILLVRRDFVAKYSQSLLGPLWFVIQPLTTTLLFSAVFAKIAKVPTDDSPATLFYLSGMVTWSYFSNSFNSCALTFTANAGIFSKVYFPRLIMPLSVIISNLFAAGIHMVLLLAVAVGFIKQKELVFSNLPWGFIVIPCIFFQVAALAFGAGLLVTALTAKYKDLIHATGFLVNFWFYATPVVFPMSIVPAEWRNIVMMNPMSFPVEAFRYIVLGRGAVDASFAAVSICMTILICVCGVLAFQHAERSFVDTV